MFINSASSSCKRTRIFLDIANHEYEEDINRMYEEGYVQGVGNGEYRPDALLTNAQAIQLAVNVFDLNLDSLQVC